MAEAFTSYLVDNDRRFRNAVQRASDAAGDLRVPFALILADFYKSEKSIFQLSGPGQYPPFKNSGGFFRKKKGGERKWVPNPASDGPMSPYQAAKLKKVGFDYPLLVRSGKLAASLLSADASGSVASIGPAQMIFGTAITYGIYHQSDSPRTKIPLRKFIFIGPEAPQFATSDQQGRPERWLNIMNDYVLAKSKESGAFNA